MNENFTDTVEIPEKQEGSRYEEQLKNANREDFVSDLEDFAKESEEFATDDKPIAPIPQKFAKNQNEIGNSEEKSAKVEKAPTRKSQEIAKPATKKESDDFFTTINSDENRNKITSISIFRDHKKKKSEKQYPSLDHPITYNEFLEYIEYKPGDYSLFAFTGNKKVSSKSNLIIDESIISKAKPQVSGDESQALRILNQQLQKKEGDFEQLQQKFEELSQNISNMQSANGNSLADEITKFNKLRELINPNSSSAPNVNIQEIKEERYKAGYDQAKMETRFEALKDAEQKAEEKIESIKAKAAREIAEAEKEADKTRRKFKNRQAELDELEAELDKKSKRLRITEQNLANDALQLKADKKEFAIQQTRAEQLQQTIEELIDQLVTKEFRGNPPEEFPENSKSKQAIDYFSDVYTNDNFEDSDDDEMSDDDLSKALHDYQPEFDDSVDSDGEDENSNEDDDQNDSDEETDED